ncbi:MAG: sterol desaturase family protein, partial [Acidobacteriota bacterium]
NIVMPGWLDRWLRLVFVTPETHRIHHSDRYEENMHNYGEMFTMWDRLLGTFQEQPEGGHEAMGIGLPGYRGGRTYNPVRLLAWPLYEGAMGGPDGERGTELHAEQEDAGRDGAVAAGLRAV